jgi:hypothetical protein
MIIPLFGAAGHGSAADTHRRQSTEVTEFMQQDLTKRWSELRPGAKFSSQVTKTVSLEARLGDGRSRSASSR